MTPEEEFDMLNPPLERAPASDSVFGCITWALILFGLGVLIRAVL